jgi:hypothetical protein
MHVTTHILYMMHVVVIGNLFLQYRYDPNSRPRIEPGSVVGETTNRAMVDHFALYSLAPEPKIQVGPFSYAVPED